MRRLGGTASLMVLLLATGSGMLCGTIWGCGLLPGDVGSDVRPASAKGGGPSSGVSTRTAPRPATAPMLIIPWRQASLEMTARQPLSDWIDRYAGSLTPGEIDYSDPAGGGIVPLMRVWGAEDVPLSEHFRVRDFAARDGAAYARISMDLVDVLERLQAHLGGRLHINSGYRHPALNFSPEVGGANESQHMAGLAADVRVEGRTPVEVAEAALHVLGCEIGLGLGRGFVHVDLRSYTASWATEGAVMDEVDFDLWVLERCGDEESRLAPANAECAEAASALALALVEVYQEEMRALARVQQRRRQPGVVLLDLRTGVPGRDASLAYALSYVLPGSPLHRTLELGPLLAGTEKNGFFVFVVIGPDGAPELGFMRYEKEVTSSPGYSTTPDHPCPKFALRDSRSVSPSSRYPL